MLHVHVYLTSPLATSYMMQPNTEHITVWETANYMSVAATLTVHLFNSFIGTNADPVFTRKTIVRKHFLTPFSTFLAASFCFLKRSSSVTALFFHDSASVIFYTHWSTMPGRYISMKSSSTIHRINFLICDNFYV